MQRTLTAGAHTACYSESSKIAARGAIDACETGGRAADSVGVARFSNGTVWTGSYKRKPLAPYPKAYLEGARNQKAMHSSTC